jgi:hypothetical protein
LQNKQRRKDAASDSWNVPRGTKSLQLDFE